MWRVSSHAFSCTALFVTTIVTMINGDESCCSRLQQNLEYQTERTKLMEDAFRRTLAILGSSLGSQFVASLEKDPVIGSIISPDQSSSVIQENQFKSGDWLLFNQFSPKQVEERTLTGNENKGNKQNNV